MKALTTPQIFEATRDDLPAVLALLQQCGLLEAGVAEAIQSFHVARSDQALVGCAGLERYGDFGLLRSVAVQPSQRAGGLGSQLVAAVAEDARRGGVRELYLLTTTAPEFFLRRGFSPVARSSVPAKVAGSWEFREGCPQSAQAMRLALRGSVTT